MWTLEAAYLSPGEANLKDEPDAGPQRLGPAQAASPAARPALLGQVAWPLGDAGDSSVSVFSSTFFDPDAVRAQAAATYTLTTSDQEVRLTVGGQFGPEPFVLTFGFGVKQFF